MTQNEENTPKTPTIPPLQEQLHLRLRESLARYGRVADEDILNEQADILDRVFRCLMEQASKDKTLAREGVIAGLKAQTSFRYTLNTLKSIKSAPPPRYKT